VPGAFCQGVKKQEHEADHSPSTSAGVKQTSANRSIPPYVFTS
jgi:hypothetical protein